MNQTLEQLFRPVLRGPLKTDTGSRTDAWAGRTVLASGDASVAIATTNVNSDSVISMVPQAHVDQTSGGHQRVLEVKSINPGVNFTVGTADGIAEIRDITVMWHIIKGS